MLKPIMKALKNTSKGKSREKKKLLVEMINQIAVMRKREHRWINLISSKHQLPNKWSWRRMMKRMQLKKYHLKRKKEMVPGQVLNKKLKKKVNKKKEKVRILIWSQPRLAAN